MEPAEKAALLRAGLRQTDPNDADALDRICMAVAWLTSQEKAKRETAKRRIREIIEIGRTQTGA